MTWENKNFLIVVRERIPDQYCVYQLVCAFLLSVIQNYNTPREDYKDKREERGEYGQKLELYMIINRANAATRGSMKFLVRIV